MMSAPKETATMTIDAYIAQKLEIYVDEDRASMARLLLTEPRAVALELDLSEDEVTASLEALT